MADGASRGSWSGWAQGAALVVLVLLSLPFVLHAVGFGLRGLREDLSGETYLFAAERPVANVAVFGHMLAGAVATVLAPLQLVRVVRVRWPWLHRRSGYVVAGCALVAGAGGLVFIPLRGTIGGPLMDVAFAGFGVCLVVAAVQAVRLARARDFERHREWALRLFVLAIGSWLYRFHYAVWHMASGGMGSEPDFSGVFDRIQLFAFYVPYLVGLEIWFRLRRRRAGQASGRRQEA